MSWAETGTLASSVAVPAYRKVFPPASSYWRAGYRAGESACAADVAPEVAATHQDVQTFSFALSHAVGSFSVFFLLFCFQARVNANLPEIPSRLLRDLN